MKSEAITRSHSVNKSSHLMVIHGEKPNQNAARCLRATAYVALIVFSSFTWISVRVWSKHDQFTWKILDQYINTDFTKAVILVGVCILFWNAVNKLLGVFGYKNVLNKPIGESLGLIKKSQDICKTNENQANDHFLANGVFDNTRLLAEMASRMERLTKSVYLDTAHERDEFIWFTKVAETGHPNALYYLGRLHKLGIGTERSDSAAVECYQKANEKGVFEATFELGMGYVVGSEIGKSAKDGLNTILKAALGGFSDAQWLYSSMSIRLALGEENKCQFIEMIKLAAEQGHPEALMELGDYHYFKKDKDPDDYVQAVRYYEKSIEAGQDAVHYPPGFGYIYGIGISQNIEVARRCICGDAKRYEISLQAARQGDFLDPKISLIRCYFEGKGVQKNLKKAFNLLRELASSNDPDGVYLLAEYYFKGIGVDRNTVLAKKNFEKYLNIIIDLPLLEREILQKCDAEKKLAYICFSGYDGKRDLKKAHELYSLHIDTLTQEEKEILEQCRAAMNKRIPPVVLLSRGLVNEGKGQGQGQAVPYASILAAFSHIKDLIVEPKKTDKEFEKAGKKFAVSISSQEKGLQPVLERIIPILRHYTRNTKAITFDLTSGSSPVLLILGTTESAICNLFENGKFLEELKTINWIPKIQEKGEVAKKGNESQVSVLVEQDSEVVSTAENTVRSIAPALTDDQIEEIESQLRQLSRKIVIERSGNAIKLDFTDCYVEGKNKYLLEVEGCRKLTGQKIASFKIPFEVFENEVIKRLSTLYHGNRIRMKGHTVILTCKEVPLVEIFKEVKDDMISQLLLQIPLETVESEQDRQAKGETLPEFSIFVPGSKAFSKILPEAQQAASNNVEERVFSFIKHIIGERSMAWLTCTVRKNSLIFQFDPMRMKSLSKDGQHFDTVSFITWLAALKKDGETPFSFYPQDCRLVISADKVPLLSDSTFRENCVTAFDIWLNTQLQMMPAFAEILYRKEPDEKEIPRPAKLTLPYTYPLKTDDNSLKYHLSILMGSLYERIDPLNEVNFREVELHTMRLVHLFRNHYKQDREVLTILRTNFRHNLLINWVDNINTEVEIFKTILLYVLHFMSRNAHQKTYEEFEKCISDFNLKNIVEHDKLVKDKLLFLSILAAEELRLADFINHNRRDAALASAAFLGELFQQDENNFRYSLQRTKTETEKFIRLDKLCKKIRMEVGHETHIGKEFYSFDEWAEKSFIELKSQHNYSA